MIALLCILIRVSAASQQPAPGPQPNPFHSWHTNVVAVKPRIEMTECGVSYRPPRLVWTKFWENKHLMLPPMAVGQDGLNCILNRKEEPIVLGFTKYNGAGIIKFEFKIDALRQYTEQGLALKLVIMYGDSGVVRCNWRTATLGQTEHTGQEHLQWTFSNAVPLELQHCGKGVQEMHLRMEIQSGTGMIYKEYGITIHYICA